MHYWGTCPHDEVNYLRAPHRHMFGIKAYKEVTHADRDIEFIMLKHKIEAFFERYYNETLKLCKFESLSCEMIAERLIKEFGLTRCEVNEDEENGAIVYADNTVPLAEDTIAQGK